MACRIAICDEIVVFDAGQIVQTGAHDAPVLHEAGLYAGLWQAQAQYYARTASAETA